VKALNKAEPRKVGIYNVGTGRGLTTRDLFIYLNNYYLLIWRVVPCTGFNKYLLNLHGNKTYRGPQTVNLGQHIFVVFTKISA
jgi:hypothetical protein